MAYTAQNYGFQAHFPLHLNIDGFGVFIKLVIATWSQILFAFPKRADFKLCVSDLYQCNWVSILDS